ncbi:T9SS type A sorting domain-containing protein [bacterium]|nr:T9SS type A sorting domain-containing protein [bacterium]
MRMFILSWLLLLLPISVFCQTAPEGAGTLENPYQISSLENLHFLSASANSSYWAEDKYFIQTNDIDASATSTWNSNAGFLPIANTTNPFKGNYNGQGYQISNLYINRGSTEYCGLFGKISDASIKNLCLEDINITGSKNVGGITGACASSVISNCSSSGEITATFSTSLIGGIMGQSTGTTLVERCFSSADIYGNNNVGGIVGFYRDEAIIRNSYFTGNIIGTSYCGGIAGQVISTGQPTIDKCYVVCTIASNNSSYSGMIIGYNQSPNISSCIYQVDQRLNIVGSGSSVNSFNFDNLVLIQSEMKEATNYIGLGWDFQTTWLLDDTTINNGYPYLYWQGGSAHSLLISNEENSQNFIAPEVNAELEFVTSLPEETQILITKPEASNTSTSGYEANLVTLGSNFWKIRTTYSDTISYHLTLDLEAIPISFQTSDVQILKRDNETSDWVNVADLGGQLSWQGRKVTISGLNTFSDFIPVIDESTLPVELSSFTANVIDNNTVSLNWQVESESNLVGYYLLENSWNNIDTAELIPSLIQATNTTQQASYNFIHHPDNHPGIVYYWLKSLELNNQSEYYGPIIANFNIENDNYPAIFSGNRLYANYPNPFNPSTAISFSVQQPQDVSIRIFNAKGQLVKKLFDGYIAQANIKNTIIWSGRDENNNKVSSGPYFINMKLADKSFTRKAILMK